MEILKQPLGRPLSMAEQVITLCAANNKLFMGIPAAGIKKFQMEMLDYVKENDSGLIREIEDEKVLTDEIAAHIVETVGKMRDSYLNQA